MSRAGKPANATELEKIHNHPVTIPHLRQEGPQKHEIVTFGQLLASLQ
jgi:hypothetical protein